MRLQMRGAAEAAPFPPTFSTERHQEVSDLVPRVSNSYRNLLAEAPNVRNRTAHCAVRLVERPSTLKSGRDLIRERSPVTGSQACRLAIKVRGCQTRRQTESTLSSSWLSRMSSSFVSISRVVFEKQDTSLSRPRVAKRPWRCANQIRQSTWYSPTSPSWDH